LPGRSRPDRPRRRRAPPPGRRRPETIAEDHARSDESWAPLIQEWFDEAPDEEERQRRRNIAAPAGRTMVDVLADVDGRYGGVREYLVLGGVSEEELGQARRRLVDGE